MFTKDKSNLSSSAINEIENLNRSTNLNKSDAEFNFGTNAPPGYDRISETGKNIELANRFFLLICIYIINRCITNHFQFI